MLNHDPIDRVFRALGDPTRRALVDRLARGPSSVSELAGPLEMTLAAVLQHLQVLEQSGLVRTEKRGRVRSCHLEPVALLQAERWLSGRRLDWDRRFDRLGAQLAPTGAIDAVPPSVMTPGQPSLPERSSPPGRRSPTSRSVR